MLVLGTAVIRRHVRPFGYYVTHTVISGTQYAKQTTPTQCRERNCVLFVRFCLLVDALTMRVCSIEEIGCIELLNNQILSDIGRVLDEKCINCEVVLRYRFIFSTNFLDFSLLDGDRAGPGIYLF